MYEQGNVWSKTCKGRQAAFLKRYGILRIALTRKSLSDLFVAVSFSVAGKYLIGTVKKVLWKRSSLRIIRRFLKEELQSTRQWNRDRLTSWMDYLKSKPFVASVTCSRYQIEFKWSVNFWLQLFSLRWVVKNILMDEILFRQSSNSRKLSRQKFNNDLACVFTARDARKNADWNQQQLTDGGILANRNSANHPYWFLSNQKKVQILAFLHVICERIVSCPPPENTLKR